MSDPLDNIAYITALEVPPDAVLAVKCQRRITHEMADNIQKAVNEAIPGRRVLVLPPDLDLVVVRDVQE